MTLRLRRFIGMVTVIALIQVAAAGAALAAPEKAPGTRDPQLVRIHDLADRVDDLQQRIDELEAALYGAPVESVATAAGCDLACQSCETGGTMNAQIVSPSGTYWGLYQFDYETWVNHGCDPDAYGSAGADEQHDCASHIDYDAWPNC